MIFTYSTKRVLLTAVYCSIFILSLSAQHFNLNYNPKHEVRAVWLTTLSGLDWPETTAKSEQSIARQKKELTDILNKLKKAKINTVLFQTRIRGTVIYPSAIEPWDGCITGTPGRQPEYDPLKFAVDECHKRGMEIQAWVVAIPVGKWNSYGCKSLRRKHPEMVMNIGGYGFINPADDNAAAYISDICREIVAEYDVDGIHLDYIRYPETWRPNISLFKARNHITRIVEQTHNAVKGIKPWVKMSCSPIGKFDDTARYSSNGWNAYNKGMQDVRVWLEKGFMDQIYPMMYFRNDQFYPFVFDWKENSYGQTVVPGLGIYFLSPEEGKWSKEDITRQMNVLRACGMGYALFRNKFLIDNTKGVLNFIENDFNRYDALVPPVKGAEGTSPKTPEGIEVKNRDNNETVSWNKVNDNKGGIMYNVYASTSRPVDTEDVRNLIAARLTDNRITLEKGTKLYYAVTATDRYGRESKAIQSATLCKHPDADITLIRNDGETIALPDKDKCLDADYLLVKSLSGTIVTTLPYKGTHADISNIKEGIYTLHSLNRKGITHRLGFMMIKRMTEKPM